MRALHLHNLTMAYGRRILFTNLSVTVTAGETLCITGDNGAGKSTLLKIAAGLTRPEAGIVEFEGGVPGGGAANRLQFGYASPDVNVYSELTGTENIDFFARLRGLTLGQSAQLFPRVGLPVSRGKDLVSAYSSGMRQRLKLAVSLLGAPRLLLWDEPTLALDARGTERVTEALAAHRAGGGMAIVATNNADEAALWGDRCLQIGRSA